MKGAGGIGVNGIEIEHGTEGSKWQLFVGGSGNTLPGGFSIQDENIGRLTIDASGNVGIGTTSPGDELHIVSNTSPIIRLQDIDTSPVQWHIGFNGPTDQFRITETGVAERLTILKTSGYVGIGTTEPQHKLDVEGYAGTWVLHW